MLNPLSLDSLSANLPPLPRVFLPLRLCDGRELRTHIHVFSFLSHLRECHRLTPTLFHVYFLEPRASQTSLVAQTIRICLQCRRPKFDSWIGKIWRREWQPTPVFLPGESHGQRSLGGYSSAKSRTRLSDNTFTFKGISGAVVFCSKKVLTQSSSRPPGRNRRTGEAASVLGAEGALGCVSSALPVAGGSLSWPFHGTSCNDAN